MKPFLIIEVTKAVALAHHCPAVSPQLFRVWGDEAWPHIGSLWEGTEPLYLVSSCELPVLQASSRATPPGCAGSSRGPFSGTLTVSSTCFLKSPGLAALGFLCLSISLQTRSLSAPKSNALMIPRNT